MRIEPTELAADIAGLAPVRGPAYLRLASGLAELIAGGELPAGSLLPSERALAQATGMSRTTVVAAYRQARESGLIERREGSGTRVLAGAVDTSTSGRRPMPLGDRPRRGRAARYLFGPPSTIDLATAALPGLDLVARSASSLPDAVLSDLVARHHNYDPRGLASVRTALADRYSADGVPTTVEQILITAGAQQAIEIVAGRFLAAGDPLVIEQPAYRGALEVFTRAGARIEGVPCDEDGMITTELAKTLRAHPARLIYVQSEVHNPTGARLSASRRRRLIDLATENGCLVVDDASLADTAFSPSPAAPLARDTRAPVLTIGSFNKLFWSGLRLGWIRGDTDLISSLAQMKGLPDFGTSMLSQQVAVQLMDRLDEARAERQIGLQHAYATATELLADLLPDWRWWQPRGGPSLWVEVPSGDAAQFASVAMRFGVAVLPANAFACRSGVSRHLRLPYALPEGRLIPGIERLAEAWHAYRENGPVDLPLRSVST